mgnify:FL=1
MATIDIGKIAFTQKGTWSSSTAYIAKDVVQYTDNGETSSYVAVANSTNQAPATNGTINTSNWNIFAKGSSIGSTNQGTWSSSTAYNKNDIVQYDSDGTHTFVAVQGSTNQAPQTAGTINTTYWTKLASGVAGSGNVDVLATVTASSSASLSIDGFFNDAIYGGYKIVFQNLVFSSTCYIREKAMNASGDISSDYGGVSTAWNDYFDTAGYYSQSYKNTGFNSYTGGNDTYLEFGRAERTSREGFQFRSSVSGGGNNYNAVLEIPHAGSTNNIVCFYRGGMRGGASTNNPSRRSYACQDKTIVLSQVTAVTGWKIYPSTGTITSGRMTLYGFKK